MKLIPHIDNTQLQWGALRKIYPLASNHNSAKGPVTLVFEHIVAYEPFPSANGVITYLRSLNYENPKLRP